jgi:hypothetical protein
VQCRRAGSTRQGEIGDETYAMTKEDKRGSDDKKLVSRQLMVIGGCLGYKRKLGVKRGGEEYLWKVS